MYHISVCVYASFSVLYIKIFTYTNVKGVNVNWELSCFFHCRDYNHVCVDMFVNTFIMLQCFATNLIKLKIN